MGVASKLKLLRSGSQTEKRTAALTQLLYATLPQRHIRNSSDL